MGKVILKEINVRSYMRDSKVKAAQDEINKYISDNNFDVISVSLFRNDEDIFYLH